MIDNANLFINILNYSIKNKASDIHLTVGEPVSYRISKVIHIMSNSIIITDVLAKIFLFELMSNNAERVKEFLRNKDADFAYTHTDNTSFRVNVFFRIGKISFVLRRIEPKPIPIRQLGLPQGVQKFITAKQGLILITGPTGSGKSTTMVSILNEINKNRKEHIITIEDPIEFIFTNDQSIFSQREIGNDTKNFHNALRACLREDPDVIMIGEMRDKETVESALELAETGHLVISTMHTSGSVQTITRLINFFPPDIQSSIQYKLGDILSGVLSQRLIPKSDGSGLIGIFELMHMNTGIRSLIREGTLNQIPQNIEMGKDQGMILMKKHAQYLEKKRIISRDSYIDFFQNT